jgi:hypothetical protein
MKVGDTFLYGPSPTATKHLYIVLTNPDTDGCILVVNVTTVYSQDKDRIDQTVLLNRSEHRFLTNELSYIYYRGATIKKVTDLQADEKAGLLVKQEPCSKSIIDNARAGVGASPHCARNICDYYKKCKDLK